jgi:hypothetical protein
MTKFFKMFVLPRAAQGNKKRLCRRAKTKKEMRKTGGRFSTG